MSDADTRSNLVKQSFLQLPVTVDIERLIEDYRSIPQEAWSSSHWDIHCSSNMVLLRGGSQGTAGDFVGSDNVDHKILEGLPYVRWLIGTSGPFGGTNQAFIFRMKPLGVTRPHVDSDPAWFEPFRIHIPIITNDGAYLLSEGRSKHLAVGEAWTFDNQAMHAVTNGDAVRTHLIFDVPRSPTVLDLIEHARFDPGSDDPTRWHAAGLPDSVPSITYAMSNPISTTEKASLGLSPEAFASRIGEVRRIARLTRADLRVGDIICAVDGVSECAVARTATDYIQVRHRPREVIELQILRDGDEVSTRLRLFPRPPDVLGAMKSKDRPRRSLRTLKLR
jgi:Aspartyl/Asparaginyl beta-hydroxylase